MADFTPEQRAKIEAYARSLIEGDEEAKTAEREARRRKKAEKLVNGSVTTLTLMQREFVIEYLVSGNATEAAGKAGYSNPDKAGPRLSKEAKIQAVISEFYFGREMTAKEVIERLGQQARAEYADYLTAGGSVDLERMKADGMMHLVKGLRPTQYGLVVDFYDAQSALVHIGRYHKLFTDRTELETEQPFIAVVKMDIDEL